MERTRLTAEVDSETLAKAQAVLAQQQVSLDETLEQMLHYIANQGSAPCFQCGEPNSETLKAIAEAEAGDLISVGTISDLFASVNNEEN